MPRLRAFLVCLVTLLALTGCKKPESSSLRGSGVQATKARSVGPFSALRVAGPLSVEISVGKAEPLEVTGDDNLLGHVTSRVEGSTLVLGTDAKLKTKQPLRVRFGVEKLDGIRAGMAANVTARGIKGDRFELEAAASSRLKLSGSARELQLVARGATRVDLGEFPVAKAVVTVSDAANVELGYLEELSAKATGASRVTYRGEPKVEQDVQKPARVFRAR